MSDPKAVVDGLDPLDAVPENILSLPKTPFSGFQPHVTLLHSHRLFGAASLSSSSCR
jgi:hypothetical protein